MPTPIKSIDISRYHPIRSAQYLAGLLIDTRYQSNLNRIFTLLEYAVCNFKGASTPTIQEFSLWLNEWEPILKHKQRLEDPCEDVYVSRCVTRWGDFRVFNGLWYGNEFWLRIVLQSFSNLPPQMEDIFFKPIKSILLLSELIAERMQAKLGVIGEPNERIKIVLDANSDHSSCVAFTRNELAAHGINFEDFTPFIFHLENPELTNNLKDGSADLIYRPIIIFNNELIVLRPTEISLAIRWATLDWANFDEKNKTIFNKKLANVYLEALRKVNILGGFHFKNVPLHTEFDSASGWIEVGMNWGNGRYLQVVIIVDTLFEFSKTGIIGLHSQQDRLYEHLNWRIKRFRDSVTKDPEFRQGLSLVIFSGYGRGIKHQDIDCPNGWDAITLTFDDFETLRWVPDFPKNTFWKLNEQVSILQSKSILFFNNNGFLNLYGWWLECGQMLLPKNYEITHEQNLVLLPIDCIAAVRQQSVLAADFRSALYIDGSYKPLRKKNDLQSEKNEPHQSLYVCFEEWTNKNFLGCALGSQLPWWVNVRIEKTHSERGLIFKLWDLTFNWMERIAETLEATFPDIKLKTIQYILDTNQVIFEPTVVEKRPEGEIVKIGIQHEESTVRVTLTDQFISAVHSTVNTAERAIVRACIEGFLLLSEIKIEAKEVDRICDIVVPNERARYFHVFTTNEFSESLFLKDYPYQIIDSLDLSFTKLGLADLSGVTGKRAITGKSECKSFLSTVVKELYDQVVSSLATFNREQLIKILFLNICGIEHDRATWKRTSRSVMGLGKNLNDYAEDRRNYFEDRIAAEHSSRILIEIAVCESKEDDGIAPDLYDLSPLMTKASLIYYLGNLSDGIDKGIIEASLEVAGNGEILQSREFQQNIMTPFTLDQEKASSQEDAEYYLSLFQKKPSDGNYPSAFTEAFAEEFGVSIDEMLQLVYAMDALFEGKDIMIISRDELITLLAPRLNIPLLERILATFSSEPRVKHSTPPEGYTSRDISPWLFRRRLSILFKPIIKLNNVNNPKYIIVPDFFFKSLLYLAHHYFTSGISPDWCRSQKMKFWIGENAKKMGDRFNADLASILRSLGYEIIQETEMTQLLPPAIAGKKFGDVDIIAWKKNTDALYIIECKDLFYAKTFREIADQMLPYRGEFKNNDPNNPDDLRKHINRLKVLSDHKDKIQMKFDGLVTDFTLHGYIVFSDKLPMLYDTSYKGSIKFSFQEEIQEKGLQLDSVFTGE